MAHYVLLAELHLPDAGNVAEYAQGLNEPGSGRARQVDLGYVAGDYHLGVDAQTCEEHLDLVGGGVLRFIEHDYSVVERAAAHECQRSNLDYLCLHVFLELDGRNHILGFSRL